MKSFLQYVAYTILVVMVLTVFSCQIDDGAEVEVNNQRTFTAVSSTADLLWRISLRDGSHDNIVDKSSCFDVNFPYVVLVHGMQITVNSGQDFMQIERLFDANEDDDDTVQFVFPITVTTANHSEIVVNNQNELTALTAKCVEDGNDEDIECIDIDYPLTLYTYNAKQEVISTVKVDDDADMQLFLAGLGESDFIGFEFPVTLKKHDGAAVIVNSNGELTTAIENSVGVCNEDDNANYNDDDFTEERLTSVLIGCPWAIQEFKKNNENGTPQYLEYLLTFGGDGSAVASDEEGNLLAGEWSLTVVDYQLKLRLAFETETDFNAEWFVYEIDEERIKFHTADDVDKIIFKKACDEKLQVCSEAFIKEQLQTCLWVVSNNANTVLSNLKFDFSDMRIRVIATNNVVIDHGFWTISGTTIVFNNLSNDLSIYNGEWEVVACSTVRFKLKRGEEQIILKKDCE